MRCIWSLNLYGFTPVISYSDTFRNAWHAGISIAHSPLFPLRTLIHRMVHTPLRVHVQHASPLAGHSHLYHTYMHRHTCIRSHMLSDPYAAVQPERVCPCKFGGCAWARSPTPAPIPEITWQLLNWQYSSLLSKAGDTSEETLIWRRKRPWFSACALLLSPPRPFTERKKRNGFFSAGRSFLPKIKRALHKLFFKGTPWCSAFLAAKEQNVELTA